FEIYFQTGAIRQWNGLHLAELDGERTPVPVDDDGRGDFQLHFLHCYGPLLWLVPPAAISVRHCEFPAVREDNLSTLQNPFRKRLPGAAVNNCDEQRRAAHSDNYFHSFPTIPLPPQCITSES